MSENGVRPHDEASDVAAEHGEVVVDGPDGATTSFTPDAARETGKRLIAEADKAEGDEPVSAAEE